MASDMAPELSKHLGQTPALVVVVCGGEDRDLSTLTQLVEQTPWTMFCRGTRSSRLDKIRDWAARAVTWASVCMSVDDNDHVTISGGRYG